VRGGDDHAGLKIILANQARHAGSSDHAGKSNACPRLREAGGKQGSDVRAGFAGVHADEDVRFAMLALEIGAERAPGGEESGVVQRRRARGRLECRRFQRTLCPWEKACFSKLCCAPGHGQVACAGPQKSLTHAKTVVSWPRIRACLLDKRDKGSLVQVNHWIRCIETSAHDTANRPREYANVKHRSRSCPPRKHRHRSFASPVPTSACA